MLNRNYNLYNLSLLILTTQKNITMKLYVIFFLIAFLSPSVQLNAQGLPSILNRIQEIIPTIDNGDDYIDQELFFDEEKPYQITFVSSITQQKRGKTTEEMANFNLGLLDKNTVRYSSNGKQIKLLIGSGRQSLINITEDDKNKGWNNELSIICDGVDTARELETLVKDAIVIAKDLWEKQNQLPSSYEELLKFVFTKVVDVSLEDGSRYQRLSQSNLSNDIVIFNTENTANKKSEKVDFQFSLGDVDPRKIKTTIKRDEVKVELGIFNNRDFIKEVDAEENIKFINGIDVGFNTPDDAFLYQSAMESLVKLGKKKIKERMPTIEDLATAQDLIKKNINPILVKNKEVNQSIEFLENTIKLITEYEEDPAIEREFEFSDFSNTVQGNFLGNYGRIEIKTKSSDKLVKVVANDELQNYENKVTFYVNEIEKMRLLEKAIKYLISIKPKERKAENLDWFKKQILEANNEELIQTMEDESSCKLKYSTEVLSKKKSSIEVNTFNIDDLQRKTAKVEIRGKQVGVQVYTRGKEKIIQQYNSSGKLSYINSIYFIAKDIVTAKTMRVTIQQLISDCE